MTRRLVFGREHALARILLTIICLALALLLAPAAEAQSRLPEFLAKMAPGELVLGADRFGPPEGQPPFAPVMAGSRLVGYAFVNSDWVNSTGYSGRPIQVLV